jgi:hypothetical protein
MDIQAREDTTNPIEVFWEDYQAQVQALLQRAGVPILSTEAMWQRRPMFDFIIHRILEHLGQMGAELLTQPNGAERLTQLFVQLTAQASAAGPAALERHGDQVAARKTDAAAGWRRT